MSKCFPRDEEVVSLPFEKPTHVSNWRKSVSVHQKTAATCAGKNDICQVFGTFFL